ncbi:hypothetical protein [Pseudomonas syringae]|uniref:Taurine catabolism dioxygenase n=1 Tax=Pseudomonas syringae pv. daphniphylli TaxID=264455 RepID=A0A9X0H2F8_PSESX|nr:hypothetical protein [Pseudomonas syringae]KPX10136.1 Uncharacterized protein ALO73_03360 [Pseudomonas syringae pv. daphniphylli]
MIPLFTFEPEENAHLLNLLEPLDLSPYKSYTGFSEGIRRLHSDVPARFLSACQIIRSERANHQQKIHVIRNCPMDRLIPELDPEDPVRINTSRKHRLSVRPFLSCLRNLPAHRYCLMRPEMKVISSPMLLPSRSTAGN